MVLEHCSQRNHAETKWRRGWTDTQKWRRRVRSEEMLRGDRGDAYAERGKWPETLEGKTAEIPLQYVQNTLRRSQNFL